ncbi:unnamed protein product [Staurois parvus]|uniref:Reverse transcriptase domain-containing protein n=1 Tax=Staurois parvus TaxID=386267 RepID=A0ABN9D9J9_9NEOB|nr:unnamed protein product [Staurois parvus]
MLLSLDLHKASDSLSWKYIFNVLQRYGFGPHFLKVLRILHSEPMARLSVKGYSSENITICRGAQQGSALSPILFILALEPQAIKL